MRKKDLGSKGMRNIIHRIVQIFKKNINVLKKLLLIIPFIIPILILYSLYPESFEATWKGRTYYLFFLWLFLLEMILNWEELQTRKINDVKLARKIALIVSLLIPTVYVIVANFYGFNHMIENLAQQHNIPGAGSMPLSIEYLVFAVLFALIILLEYGINGLKNFPISTVFLGIIGVIYTIDNVYPYGRFTYLQFFVPTTATLAAKVLNLMGYKTKMFFISNDPTYGSIPYLMVTNSQGKIAEYGIAWPCAGVESLLIYTVAISLFLIKAVISWKRGIIYSIIFFIIYFVIGALVTYFINILRIVTIFVIAVNGGDIGAFHNYYGQLYSVTWIISYPLIIIGSRALWGKIRNWKTGVKDGSGSCKTIPKQKYRARMFKFERLVTKCLPKGELLKNAILTQLHLRQFVIKHLNRKHLREQ
jgi:thaumarchaeosortase